MRAQAQWAEHAAFMNALAAEGFVVLGLSEGRWPAAACTRRV